MRDMKVPGIVYVPSAFTGTNRRIAHDRLWSALVRMKDRRLGPVSVGVPGRFESMLIDAWEGAETPNKVLENLISNNPTPVLYDLAAVLEDRLGLSENDGPAGQLPMSWETSPAAILGVYSKAVTACTLNDTLGTLALTRPVLGARPTYFGTSSDRAQKSATAAHG